ncbi:MAG: pectinesterase family protein [Defluviitaleaceae bacterium]|nr:pectinesterase family protein [Defluviitaleaceae bacterium]
MTKYIVAKDGLGDFDTIQAAIDHMGKGGGKIYVKAGEYIEKISITANNVMLIGDDAKSTIISYGDYARKIDEYGKEYGTFRSQSVYVSGNDFCAIGISFVNSAGAGNDVGQAVAFYGDGDRHGFYNCEFHGHQDTLFMSPLPPNPQSISPLHRSYFEDCLIRGDVDFIFGGSVSYFENCTIISNDRGLTDYPNGYITAACTPQGFEYGYVFHKCRLESDAAPDTVYLGRPWRDYAKTVLIDCYMGAHIKQEGWHNWRRPEAEQTAFYAEYKSHGTGGNMTKRVPWSRELSVVQAAEYTIENILSGWLPQIQGGNHDI